MRRGRRPPADYRACAPCFEDVESKLANDPDYRTSVLTESVQVGVGVRVRRVGRQLQFDVTELFAFPPGITGVSATREYALKLMRPRRSLIAGAELSRAARHVASQLVAGIPVEYAIDEIPRAGRGPKTEFDRTIVLVRTVADATTLSLGSSLDNPAISHYGIAVVEAREAGLVHVVIVLGVNKGRWRLDRYWKQ